MTDVKNYEVIWGPENLLLQWVSASFILLTSALLFFHMVRLSSIEMNRTVAAVFAISLISICVIMSTTALFTYTHRSKAIMKDINRL